MVFIEEKSSYIEELKSNPAVADYINFFLYGINFSEQDVSIIDSGHAAKLIYLYLSHSNKEKGVTLINEFSKREPNRSTPWIFDEFVIFALVSGIKFFGITTTWIEHVLRLRMQTNDSEVLEITKAYFDLLSGNLNKNLYQISVIYFNLTGDSILDPNQLNFMFTSLWRKTFPFYISDFLNIISFKALEIGFVSKGLLNPEEKFQYHSFTTIFLKRTKTFSKILSWLFSSGLGITIMIYAIKAISAPENSILKIAFYLLGFVGVGGVFTLPKFLTPKVELLIRRLFGYKF